MSGFTRPSHTTGKCVNQLKIEECSNKIRVVEDKSIEQLPADIRGKIKERNILWGYGFSEAEVSHITYRYPTNLILIVGEPYSGKSTLYGALFDSFHKGGCGDYYFNSSRTQLAFEEICHLSREKCKGKTPKTERTKTFEFSYYHLSVRNKDLKSPAKHLLFADVNGEKFQLAKDKDEEVKRLQILQQADHIFFIADGKLLMTSTEKHAVKKDVWNLLTRCLETNMIREDQKINLIVTKWDEVSAAGAINDVTKFFIDPTLEKYSKNINSKVLKVASRSMNDHIPPRTGIDEFLHLCLEKKPADATNFKPGNGFDRPYQQFKYRLDND